MDNKIQKLKAYNKPLNFSILFRQTNKEFALMDLAYSFMNIFKIIKHKFNLANKYYAILSNRIAVKNMSHKIQKLSKIKYNLYMFQK